MMALYAKSKKPIDFGAAAPSVPYFIGSKVILLCMVCECPTGCNSYRINLRFGMMVLYAKSKKPIDFGAAAPSVPYFTRSKVILLCMVCECSTGCNSYRINLRFGMMVLYAKSSLLILVMLPPVFRVL